MEQLSCFFFQAEDGIRDVAVTGVQTCALPILLLALARTEMVQFLVDRVAGVDLPLDTVQAGAQHRREREVWVAGRVWRTVLDALRGLDPLVVHRDTDVRAAVALRPGDEHGRLVTRHEPAV